MSSSTERRRRPAASLRSRATNSRGATSRAVARPKGAPSKPKGTRVPPRPGPAPARPPAAAGDPSPAAAGPGAAARPPRPAAGAPVPAARPFRRSVIRYYEAGIPAAVLGSKAHRLAELGRAGLPIPPWVCLGVDVTEPGARRSGADPDPGSDVESGPTGTPGGLSRDELASLLDCFDTCFPRGALVAVRASVALDPAPPAADSGPGAGSAQLRAAATEGLFESFLAVDRATLAESIGACFASARTASALLERRVRGLEGRPLRAGALVQALVDARASGTLAMPALSPAQPAVPAAPGGAAAEEGAAGPGHGRDAARPRPDGPARAEDTPPQAILLAGLGLGVGVTGELVEADTYFVDAVTGRIDRRAIAAKRSRVAPDRTRGRGTRLEAVPAEEGDRPALGDAEVAALWALARDVVRHAGGVAHTIEWAVDAEGAVHLIQAWPTPRGRVGLYDGALLQEAFPGTAGPLTFSLAARVTAETVGEAARRLGLEPGAARRLGSELLALVNGRASLNVLAAQDVLRGVPDEALLVPRLGDALAAPHARAEPRRPLGRGAWLGALARVLRLLPALRRDVAAYEANVAALARETRPRGLADLEAHELYARYEEALARLLPGAAAAHLVSACALRLRDALDGVIFRWKLGDPARLRGALLCDEAELASVTHVRSLLELLERTRALAGADELLAAERDPAETLKLLTALPGAASFRAALAAHLEQFGDRVPYELHLESLPLWEDRELLVALLRGGLREGAPDPARLRLSRKLTRAAAEAQVARQLSFGRRLLFRRLLALWRSAERRREALRLARCRAAGAIRRLLGAMGRELAAAGLLAAPGDVFWLTADEVGAQVRGQAVDRDLRALVALRRSQYERFRALPPAGRVATRGIVTANRLAGTWVERSGPIRGEGASSGRVRARARVVRDAGCLTVPMGEVLVASAADPGLGLLMASAAGLVLEAEGAWHAGVLGCELGIPVVLGVRGACRRIRDGQLLEVDGETGDVILID